MTEPVLKVDPAVLQQAGTVFGHAGDDLAQLRSDELLATAAAGVPHLATAAACQAAQTVVSTEATSVADTARRFGHSLETAAGHYVGQDQCASRALQNVQLPN